MPIELARALVHLVVLVPVSFISLAVRVESRATSLRTLTALELWVPRSGSGGSTPSRWTHVDVDAHNEGK